MTAEQGRPDWCALQVAQTVARGRGGDRATLRATVGARWWFRTANRMTPPSEPHKQRFAPKSLRSSQQTAIWGVMVRAKRSNLGGSHTPVPTVRVCTTSGLLAFPWRGAAYPVINCGDGFAARTIQNDRTQGFRVRRQQRTLNFIFSPIGCRRRAHIRVISRMVE